MVTFGRFAAFSLLVSIATASHVVISTIGTGTGIAEGVPRYLTTSPHQARRSRIQPCTDITSLSLAAATSTHNDLPTSHSDSRKPQLTISVQKIPKMASINPTGIFRFVEPDLTIPAQDRAIFANPRPKHLVQLELPLHDIRTSNEITSGSAGLDVQGFTYLHHVSALSPEQMLAARNAEDVLAPETLEMMIKYTGAKRGVVHSVGFRRIPASKQLDLEFVPLRGSEIDLAMERIPKDQMLGMLLVD